MNTLTPFLWFETQAEEAARYYAGIFPGGKMGEITRFAAGSIGPEGSVMTASFEIAGHELVALNGNRRHAFSPATSLHIACNSDEQAARVSEKLAAGGLRQPGGWLRDKFGVSWQVSGNRRAP
jgi:predicted 3-demethylubiquinone-9 3-methyltransferase (glyoxalase superfamily)